MENETFTIDRYKHMMTMEEVKLKDLTPDDKNFNKGTEFGTGLLEKSLRNFGAGRSILIDKNNRIIAGNKTAEQCGNIGLDDVLIVESDGKKLVAVKRTDIDIDTPEGREMALADNAVGIADLDFDIDAIQAELGMDKAEEWGVEMPSDEEYERMKREFEERLASGEISEEDEEYQQFVDKFTPKKTTDDCYTPPIVYEALEGWVENKYGVDRKNFVRPFYPGGDYRKFKYNSNSVVVDNPPFSILAEIISYYVDNDIMFFLFAPTLTIFNSNNHSSTCICVGIHITYANGANVNTSFVTNMEARNIAFMSDGSLYKCIKEANDKNLRETKKELPKYEYDKHVISSTLVGQFSRYNIDFTVNKDQCKFVRQLECQKESGKAIYGGGFIVSDCVKAEREKAEREKAEREKAEREKAEVWELSENELNIVKTLN